MKKIVNVLISIGMVIMLASCSRSDAPVWTREGYFEDDRGDLLYVTTLEDQTEEGYYVMFVFEDGFTGGFLPQKGSDLKGKLYSDLETKEGEMDVTISEEGEDGLKLTVQGGKTYSFVPSDIEERTFTVMINTDGLGFFNAQTDADAYETDDDYSTTSMVLNLQEPVTYTLSAKAGDEWEFVKWTIDGNDYSEENEITLEFSQNADIVAVFEFPESDE